MIKTIILTLCLILGGSVITSAQNDNPISIQLETQKSCCCVPEPIIFHGKVTLAPNSGQNPIVLRQVRISHWDSVTQAYSSVTPNLFGYWSVFTNSCAVHFISPYMTKKAPSGLVPLFNPPGMGYDYSVFYQVDTELNMELSFVPQ